MSTRVDVAAPTGRLAAVLWDMDGLLVDTEPLWYETELAVMARLGGAWDETDQVACLGQSMEYTVGRLLRRSGSDRSAAEVGGWLVREMVDRLARGVALRPGAGDLLRALTELAVPCALVSSSRRALVDAVLGTVGAHRFAVTVAGDEVRRRKPDPEPYARAAAMLRVRPARCVVLEDTETGARAGAAAGCATVCVPSLLPVPADSRWVVRESLAELTVRDLVELVTPPS